MKESNRIQGIIFFFFRQICVLEGKMCGITSVNSFEGLDKNRFWGIYSVLNTVKYKTFHLLLRVNT